MVQQMQIDYWVGSFIPCQEHITIYLAMASHDDEICVALTRMALAGDGVVIGLGMSCLAIKTWLKYRTHQQALHTIKDTPLSPIADLRTLIHEHTPNIDHGLAISNHHVRPIPKIALL